MNNGIRLEEQETVVNFYRVDHRMSIYTSDQTMITKLMKLIEKSEKNSESEYILVREEKMNGRVVAIEVSAPKHLMSLRMPKKKRELTEEEIKELADRMRKARNHGND